MREPMNQRPPLSPGKTAGQGVRWRRVIAGTSVLVLFVLLTWAVFGLKRVQRDSLDRSSLSILRSISATAGQLFLENPHRLFIDYQEVVGPKGHQVKALESVQGEDLLALFPIRRDQLDEGHWILMLPNGRKISYLPPPAPKPDGVDVVLLPEAGRFETTYRGGVADGPFRAFYPDGKLWGEASYVQGRVTGPRRLYMPDGRGFDEAAVRTAEAPAQLGIHKYLTRGYAGAIAELNRAIEINPTPPDWYRVRGDAYRALGNLESALADFTRSLETKPENSVYYRRGHIRRWLRDLPGAIADFQAAIGDGSASEKYNPAVFWLYVTGCEQGHAQAASARLDAFIEKMRIQRDEWEWRLGALLRGQMTEDQFRATYHDNSQRDPNVASIEALFYTAMRDRLAGDHASALKNFRAVLAVPSPQVDEDYFDDAYEFLRDEARRVVEAAGAGIHPPPR